MNEKIFSETIINSVDKSVQLLKVTLKGSHSVKKKKKKRRRALQCTSFLLQPTGIPLAQTFIHTVLKCSFLGVGGGLL